MGNCSSAQHEMRQVMLAGLEGAGKTQLLYSLKISSNDNVNPEPTVGFHYEELRKHGFTIGVWDLAGEEGLRHLWKAVYRNVTIDAVIFVVDAADSERSWIAKHELTRLMNEEELRDCAFVVLINNRQYNPAREGDTGMVPKWIKLLGIEKRQDNEFESRRGENSRFIVREANVYNSSGVDSVFDWLARTFS